MQKLPEIVPGVDKNRHVNEYLSYYVSHQKPLNYAVLIDGAWGIGKTFIIKNFLTTFMNNEKQNAIYGRNPVSPCDAWNSVKKFFIKNFTSKPIILDHQIPVYVSLFGLTTIEEIDDALFKSMYSSLGWGAAKVTGDLLNAASKKYIIPVNIKIFKLINKYRAPFYVFDDLERCEMPINKTLGYINDFVEHGGCKVIIIASEAEISEQVEYRRRREKLIGKTLEVQPAFDEALGYFTSAVDSPATKALFENKAAEISAIYRQSELNNFRVLQQTMWDFEWFHRVLTDEHRQNDKAMTALLRLIFALSFELKAGRLGEGDIVKRMPIFSLRVMAKREDSEPAPIVQAQERYPEIDLVETVLSNASLVNILIKGIVDRTDICDSLNQSAYFISRSNKEPCWFTMWHVFERTDAEFDTAYQEFESKFSNREFLERNEILHMFGMRLWLSEIGVLRKGRAEIVEEGKNYVDDLYSSGKLESSVTESFESAVKANTYRGYQNQERDTEEYRIFSAYLTDRIQAADRIRYPEWAATLLHQMTVDPDFFSQQIMDRDDGRFYKVPILATLDPDKFIARFLNLHSKQQQAILRSFQYRYGKDRLDRELAPERRWLKTVRDKLATGVDDLPAIGQWRRRLYCRWLDDILGSTNPTAPYPPASTGGVTDSVAGGGP